MNEVGKFKMMDTAQVSVLAGELDGISRLLREADDKSWDTYKKENSLSLMEVDEGKLAGIRNVDDYLIFYGTNYKMDFDGEVELGSTVKTHAFTRLIIDGVSSLPFESIYHIHFPVNSFYKVYSLYTAYKDDFNLLDYPSLEVIPNDSINLLDGFIDIEADFYLTDNKGENVNVYLLKENKEGYLFTPPYKSIDGVIENLKYDLGCNYRIYSLREGNKILLEVRGFLRVKDGKYKESKIDFITYAEGSGIELQKNKVFYNVKVYDIDSIKNFYFKYDIDTWSI